MYIDKDLSIHVHYANLNIHTIYGRPGLYRIYLSFLRFDGLCKPLSIQPVISYMIKYIPIGNEKDFSYSLVYQQIYNCKPFSIAYNRYISIFFLFKLSLLNITSISMQAMEEANQLIPCKWGLRYVTKKK